MNRITPRNKISIKDALPKRWEFLSIQLGMTKTWETLSSYIDTVAEHADALMNANGVTPSKAVDQAINDLIKIEREEDYTTGYFWNLTPKHRKAIVEWLEA